jgi:DNA-binding NarL/FixJ family response regulator
MKPQVVVADDGSLALRGARDVLSSTEYVHLAGVSPSLDAVNVGEVVARGAIIVADPFVDGDFPGQLADLARLAPVLVLSTHTEPSRIQRALRCGVRGYMDKNVDSSRLVAAVHAVAVGGIYLDVALADAIMGDVVVALPDEKPSGLRLTPREQEVLGMIAKGLTHKQIGSQLVLSKATVDTYVHRIRQKAGVANKAGLTRVAIDLGLLSAATAFS